MKDWPKTGPRLNWFDSRRPNAKAGSNKPRSMGSSIVTGTVTQPVSLVDARIRKDSPGFGGVSAQTKTGRRRTGPGLAQD